MKKIQEKSISPKPIVSSKLCLLLALFVMCIILFVMWTEQQLHRTHNAPPPSPSQQTSIAPSLETGGCADDAENSCVQTLLVSEHGKIESATGKKDAHTSLKLTNTKGEEYIFADSENPFITYERAAFNGTKSEAGDTGGYYLVSAANRGKDGFNTFDKVYEVWLGEKLEVKPIITQSGIADPNFLKWSNQISYFSTDATGKLHFMIYNLSDNTTESDDNYIYQLLTRSQSWYKNKLSEYYLIGAQSVPDGYILQFSQNGLNKGTVIKMLYWEQKTERIVLLK